jgi:glycosyltransferase
MKTILHIVEPLASGVLSYVIALTAEQVIDNEVVVLWGVRKETPNNLDTLFDKRVRLIKMKYFCGALKTVLNPLAYWEVRQYVNRFHPEIIHMHSSASGFVGRWSLIGSRARCFYTPHGYSFLMQNGGKFKQKLFWALEYLSAFLPCKTITCSKSEYNEARKLTNNVTLVNNGVDISFITPYCRNLEELQRPIRICTVGRILHQKNPQVFNEIAQLLPEAQFLWIGEGELKSLLTAPNITITGWVDREQGLSLIQGCDFFLLPSLYEGLPISLLEAMFLKKVCLVSNVVGNKDVVQHKKNGYICEEAKDFAKAILHLTNSLQECHFLIENAHKDVLQNYNTQKMAEQYMKIYSAHSLGE